MPDVPAAAAGLLASYLFWKYLREPGWSMAWFAGLALGLALLTKNTWLVLLAVWPVLIVLGKLNPLRDDTRSLSAAIRPRFRHLLLMWPVAWLVLCAGYGFTKIGRPLGEFQFVSHALGGESDYSPGRAPTPVAGNCFHDTSISAIPVPLPADLIVGIDLQKYDFERGFPSYMNGEWSFHGWWYYYLYAMAIKLPLPTLLLTLAGFFWCLVAPRSLGRTDEWALLVPAIAVIAFVSSQTGFNHHMRYVLPAFPLLFIAAGRLAWLTVQQRWLGGAIAALLVWCGTATASVAPYFMSYFNPLASGPENGWRHLVDSNIDWGQDLLHLRKWMDDHPDARPMGVQTYNLVEPRHIGMDVIRVPVEPTPGWWAVDVNYVAGGTFRMAGPPPGPYAYFQHLTPADRAGYAIDIYVVTPDEANRVRALLGLPPWVSESPAEGRP